MACSGPGCADAYTFKQEDFNRWAIRLFSLLAVLVPICRSHPEGFRGVLALLLRIFRSLRGRGAGGEEDSWEAEDSIEEEAEAVEDAPATRSNGERTRKDRRGQRAAAAGGEQQRARSRGAMHQARDPPPRRDARRTEELLAALEASLNDDDDDLSSLGALITEESQNTRLNEEEANVYSKVDAIAPSALKENAGGKQKRHRSRSRKAKKNNGCEIGEKCIDKDDTIKPVQIEVSLLDGRVDDSTAAPQGREVVAKEVKNDSVPLVAGAGEILRPAAVAPAKETGTSCFLSLEEELAKHREMSENSVPCAFASCSWRGQPAEYEQHVANCTTGAARRMEPEGQLTCAGAALGAGDVPAAAQGASGGAISRQRGGGASTKQKSADSWTEVRSSSLARRPRARSPAELVRLPPGAGPPPSAPRQTAASGAVSRERSSGPVAGATVRAGSAAPHGSGAPSWQPSTASIAPSSQRANSATPAAARSPSAPRGRVHDAPVEPKAVPTYNVEVGRLRAYAGGAEPRRAGVLDPVPLSQGPFALVGSDFPGLSEETSDNATGAPQDKVGSAEFGDDAGFWDEAGTKLEASAKPAGRKVTRDDASVRSPMPAMSGRAASPAQAKPRASKTKAAQPLRPQTGAAAAKSAQLSSATVSATANVEAEASENASSQNGAGDVSVQDHTRDGKPAAATIPQAQGPQRSDQKKASDMVQRQSTHVSTTEVEKSEPPVARTAHSEEQAKPQSQRTNRFSKQLPRAALVKSIFAALDADGDGVLCSEEMRFFAELSGFDGDDADWRTEFRLLSKEWHCEASGGIDSVVFAKMVDDKSSNGCYCSDRELVAIRYKLSGKTASGKVEKDSSVPAPAPAVGMGQVPEVAVQPLPPPKETVPSVCDEQEECNANVEPCMMPDSAHDATYADQQAELAQAVSSGPVNAAPQEDIRQVAAASGLSSAAQTIDGQDEVVEKKKSAKARTKVVRQAVEMSSSEPTDVHAEGGRDVGRQVPVVLAEAVHDDEPRTSQNGAARAAAPREAVRTQAAGALDVAAGAIGSRAVAAPTSTGNGDELRQEGVLGFQPEPLVGARSHASVSAKTTSRRAQPASWMPQLRPALVAHAQEEETEAAEPEETAETAAPRRGSARSRTAGRPSQGSSQRATEGGRRKASDEKRQPVRSDARGPRRAEARVQEPEPVQQEADEDEWEPLQEEREQEHDGDVTGGSQVALDATRADDPGALNAVLLPDDEADEWAPLQEETAQETSSGAARGSAATFNPGDANDSEEAQAVAAPDATASAGMSSEVSPTERRFDCGEGPFTYAEFADFYGPDAMEMWLAAHPADDDEVEAEADAIHQDALWAEAEAEEEAEEEAEQDATLAPSEEQCQEVEAEHVEPPEEQGQGDADAPDTQEFFLNTCAQCGETWLLQVDCGDDFQCEDAGKPCGTAASAAAAATFGLQGPGAEDAASDQRDVRKALLHRVLAEDLRALAAADLFLSQGLEPPKPGELEACLEELRKRRTERTKALKAEAARVEARKSNKKQQRYLNDQLVDVQKGSKYLVAAKESAEDRAKTSVSIAILGTHSKPERNGQPEKKGPRS